MSATIKVLKEAAALILLAPFVIIGISVLIVLLSWSIEVVTGHDLIREIIRPAFARG